MEKDAEQDKRDCERDVFPRRQNVQQQVFGEWAMALLSPPPRGDHHAHRGRRHASHHDDNGPSPPPPHSKLSFLLFDFTFGQEFRSAASADSHAAARERSKQRPGRGFGVEGGGLPSWGFADPVVAAPSSAVAVLQHGNGGEGEGLGRLGLVGSGWGDWFSSLGSDITLWFGLVCTKARWDRM